MFLSDKDLTMDPLIFSPCVRLAKTAQKRSVATGGSQTTGFLPDLIRSNVIKARRYLVDFGSAIRELRSTDVGTDEIAGFETDFGQFEESLNRFEEHADILLKKCVEIEEEDMKKENKKISTFV